MVPSDNMDLEWFFKEFLLQCAVNLFCVLVILLAIWIYVEFWMKPPHPPQVRSLYLIISMKVLNALFSSISTTTKKE